MKQKKKKARDRQSEEHGYVMGPMPSRERVDTDTLKYFLELQNLVGDEGSVEDPEERATLCCNALEEARGKELRLACHPSCSRVLEKLLRCSSVDHNLSFLDSSGHAFAGIAMDPSGSHVAEAALESLHQALRSSPGDELLQSAEAALSKLSQVLKTSAVGLMTSRYGSHVLRKYLQLLSGKEYEDHSSSGLAKKLGKGNQSKVVLEVHRGFPDILKLFIEDLLDSCKERMSETRLDPHGSLVFQLILRTLKGNEGALAEVISLILECGDDIKEGRVLESDTTVASILEMTENRNGSHLMEVVLEEAPDGLYMELLQQVFVGNLVRLALHQNANFVVQALISAVRQQGQVNLIVDELKTCFSELVKNKRAGVIAALAAACARFSTREKKMCRAIAKVMSKSSENPVSGLLYLDASEEKGSSMSLLGCAILQTIFTFSTKDTFIPCFVALDQQLLLAAAKDRAGCHVIEAFLMSPASAEEKLEVITKLSGNFSDLALHPGSHYLVFKCYDAADMKLREKITSELVPIQNDLSKTKQGPYLLKKFNVAKYAKVPQSWMSSEKSKAATRQAFAELFEDGKEQKSDARHRKRKKDQANGLEKRRTKAET